jgi:predicted nucleotidyltransferase
MIKESARAEIDRRLSHVEQEHNVRILYAVESGSRAWGFASPNSDYDVRFVYAHKPEWYLSVFPQRDVIEYPIVDDIDLSGWDVRKALQLFYKSNPSLVEWLQSPMVYRDDKTFAAALRELLKTSYSNPSGWHHYRSMARTNYRGYLREDTVPLKKYFYVLRPLLAMRWIETYKTAPPIEFEALLGLLNKEPEVRAAINELVARKMQALEKEIIPRNKTLTGFIEAELSSDVTLETKRVDCFELNRLLLNMTLVETSEIPLL